MLVGTNYLNRALWVLDESILKYGTEKAVEVLLLDEERFSKSARYVYAIGRYYALANETLLQTFFNGPRF